jgi:ABC-2 type transport system ATP-binding protein
LEEHCTPGYAVDVSGVGKAYAGQRVLRDVSLRVPTGAVLALVGPNGAGKSSLLRILMGLAYADAGTGRILDYPLLAGPGVGAPASPRLGIGYVPELHHIYRWMRVDECLGFVRALHAHWNHELEERLLALFRLPRKKPVGQLSKGMMAALGLVLALAHRPQLLILDEPTSGLDPVFREDFLECIRSPGVLDPDCAVLLSSHNMDDVQHVADAVAILVQGRIVVAGAPQELCREMKRISMGAVNIPSELPPEIVFHNQRPEDWVVTVYPYSESWLDDWAERMQAARLDVSDLNLDAIFKDVVRGQLCSR